MPVLKESELKKHLSEKQFSKLYVFWGDEKKYVKSYTDILVEKIMGKTPSDFNYHSFTDVYDVQDICMSLLTVPFMDDYNLVKISDLNPEELSKEDFDKLLQSVKTIPEGSVAVFSMPTLQQDPKKLGRFKKILDEAEKSGVVCEFKRMGDMALEKHLSVLASRRKVSLSRINADKIISLCGNDLTALTNELDKLCAYAGENGEITEEDIELLVTKNLEARVFSLADAVVSGKGSEAYRILETLFYQREEPIAVLTVLSNAYVDYYRSRVGQECGLQTDTIAKEFNYRNRAFVLKKRTSLSTEALRKSLAILLEADTQLKSVSVNPRLLLEKTIGKLLDAGQKRREYA